MSTDGIKLTYVAVLLMVGGCSSSSDDAGAAVTPDASVAGETGSVTPAPGMFGSCSFASNQDCVAYNCLTVAACTGMQTTAASGCTVANGTWSSGDCSKTGSLGTCTDSAANDQQSVTTYYQDDKGLRTAQTIQALCTQRGGTFSSP